MKEKSKFVCSACGYTSSKWLGKCSECEGWNTFQEEVVRETKRTIAKGSALTPSHLSSHISQFQRFSTGIDEVDLVFGGGIVEGSISLLSGEPGIGKSTLTLQICNAFIRKSKKVLYIAGEESGSQIAQRAKRIGVGMEMEVINETVLEDVIETAKNVQPDLLVIDSIQVVYSDAISGVPGSVSQVRYAAEKLMELAKKEDMTVLLIGHVTKDGTLAGPRVLEHLVDVVLFIEGERYQNLRLLKTFKNRFGATDEVGVFEMTEKGLTEVKNPLSLFIEEGDNKIGAVVTSIMEGTRPFFIEIQALVTYSKFGYPKRTVSGIDLNRLNIIIAVLGKYAGVNLDSYDVYVSTVGGFNTRDPSIDLAVALAIISSKLQKPIPSTTVAIGEIGLSGSVRPVMQLEKRMKEARKLGLVDIVAPRGKVTGAKDGVIEVKYVKEAMERMFK